MIDTRQSYTDDFLDPWYTDSYSHKDRYSQTHQAQVFHALIALVGALEVETEVWASTPKSGLNFLNSSKYDKKSTHETICTYCIDNNSP